MDHQTQQAIFNTVKNLLNAHLKNAIHPHSPEAIDAAAISAMKNVVDLVEKDQTPGETRDAAEDLKNVSDEVARAITQYERTRKRNPGGVQGDIVAPIAAKHAKFILRSLGKDVQGE